MGQVVEKKENKSSVLSGLIWKFGERIGAQLVTLLVSMYLKNLLGPEQYGMINIVTIFITIANVFVTSGFGNALIQKKDADNLDFSTVFYFNIGFSFLIYGILFLCSPLIASLYDAPILSPVLRVLGLRIPIAAINSVQQAFVSRNMLFRKFFFSTLTGTVVSGVVGIVMAQLGFGIWSLVAQYLTNVAMGTIVLHFTISWRPSLVFSWQRLKGLFSYGWKLLVSGLIETGYTQLRGLIIGLKYTENDLSFYQNGNEYPNLLSVNISASITSVLFPVISKYQDDIKKVKELTRRSIKTSSYIMFPIMTGFALVAIRFFDIFFENEWLESVKYCQLACIVYAFWPIHTANLEAMKAVGRSDLYLKLEIIKKAVGVTALLISMQISVYAIAFSGVITTMISAFINAFPNKKLLGYGYFEQIKDMLPAIFYSVVMAGAVLLAGLIPIGTFPVMCIQILVGMLVYILVSVITKSESFKFLWSVAKSAIFKRKNN